MSSDVLHDALMTWAIHKDEYGFVASLMSSLPKEDALKVMCMFLRIDSGQLEENVDADEGYQALKDAVGLNDWAEILQMMFILDTIEIDEVMTALSAFREER